MSLHEPAEKLSEKTLEMHRALKTLMEELEAVDWYGQRIDATQDEELRRVLAHNQDEEKEHACMTLEWIRRRDPAFDGYLRSLLFTSGPIVSGTHPAPEAEVTLAQPTRAEPTLAVGSLRQKVESLREKDAE